jgi:hypothetical protein
LIFLATPADAHCYRIWHYLKPQRCFTALAPLHRTVLSRLRTEEIPLPDLNWIDCPLGDERLRGIALLRDLKDVPAQR